MSESSSVMPLDGYRVLDLSTMLTGPYCTRMLSDYGADVIKVEPKGGDPARTHGPFLNDDPDPEKSGLFLFLNTNKRSITVDLESQSGQEIIKKLVKKSSILVENFNKLGLGYRDLSQINPSLVMTSITNFGQTGPYSNWEGVDITIWAMGGAMKTSGNGMYEPLKIFTYIGIVIFGAGFAISLRFLYFYLNNAGQGHLQSLILSAVLMIVGFQVLLIGLVADVISGNRKLIEDLVYRVRKMELSLGTITDTNNTDVGSTHHESERH